MVLQIMHDVLFIDFERMQELTTPDQLADRIRNEMAIDIGKKLANSLDIQKEVGRAAVRYESRIVVISITTWNDIEERLRGIIRHTNNPVTKQALMQILLEIRNNF